MGIWRWIPAAERPALAQMALDGQHWMLTPWRDDRGRARRATAVDRAGVRELSIERGTQRHVRNSPLHLDLQPEEHGPHRPDGRVARATGRCPRVLPSDPQAATLRRPHRHARGDTAFATKITDASPTRRGTPGRNSAASRNTPSRRSTDRRGLEGRDLVVHEDSRVSRHPLPAHRVLDGGDDEVSRVHAAEDSVRARRARSRPKKHIKVVGPRKVAWIPSSASPPAPEVLYVVPTFGWVRTANAQGNPSSWRRGGGLRVYLNRPWNVSGYGEMLAVVLPPRFVQGRSRQGARGQAVHELRHPVGQRSDLAVAIRGGHRAAALELSPGAHAEGCRRCVAAPQARRRTKPTSRPAASRSTDCCRPVCRRFPAGRWRSRRTTCTTTRTAGSGTATSK